MINGRCAATAMANNAKESMVQPRAIAQRFCVGYAACSVWLTLFATSRHERYRQHDAGDSFCQTV